MPTANLPYRAFTIFDATTGDTIADYLSLADLYHALQNAMADDPERQVFIGDANLPTDGDNDGWMTGWPIAQQCAAVKSALQMQTQAAVRQNWARLVAAKDDLMFAQKDYDNAVAAAAPYSV